MSSEIKALRTITVQELLYLNNTLRLCLQEINENGLRYSYDLEEHIQESHRILSSLVGGKYDKDSSDS